MSTRLRRIVFGALLGAVLAQVVVLAFVGVLLILALNAEVQAGVSGNLCSPTSLPIARAGESCSYPRRSSTSAGHWAALRNSSGKRWTGLLRGPKWAGRRIRRFCCCEERFELARACARRARRAYENPDTASLEPLLWLIEFLTLLRLDEIDAAVVMAASDQLLTSPAAVH